MKAIYYDHYGPPDVLSLIEIPKPIPKDDEVLIRIHAASINSWDWDMLRGKPVFVRLWGLFKPKYKIPGADIAGTIETVGRLVKKFKPGDDVFGDIFEQGWGGFAEYACAKENQLAFKPPGMSFEQAAATPQAGLMALQSIRDLGKVKPIQHVLINGAGGGVGTFGIQLVKFFGAEVTAVDSAQKLETLKSLGADHVIDYTQVDFTENGKSYDLVIDVVANRPILQYKRALKPDGQFIMIGGTMKAILQMMTLVLLRRRTGKLGMLEYKANEGLDFMATLFEQGHVTPVIDRSFSLSETAEAFRYFGEGRFKGKIIIKV